MNIPDALESRLANQATDYIPSSEAQLIKGRPSIENAGPIQAGEIWLESAGPDTIVFVTVLGNRKDSLTPDLGLRDWSRITVNKEQQETTIYVSSSKSEHHGQTHTLIGSDHESWAELADQLVNLASSESAASTSS